MKKLRFSGVLPAGRLSWRRGRARPPGGGATQKGTATPGVARLLASGLFDETWYAAAAGVVFPGRRAAAHHFVRHGLARGLMPHFLLDAAALPADVAEAARGGALDALLDHLRTPSAVTARLGQLFDGRRSPGSPEAKSAHPGGALGLFLATATDATVLPVPDTHPTAAPDLGTARASLTRAAAAFERQRRLLARVRRTWALQAWDLEPSTAGPAPSVSVLLPPSVGIQDCRRLLDAIEGQTHGDWEVVALAGDEEAAHRSRTDPRYRVVHSDPGDHPTPGRLRNLALARATGDVVALADPGVDWDPRFLATVAARMAGDDVAAALAAVVLPSIGSAAARIRRPHPSHEAWRAGQHVDPGAVLVRRDAVLEVGGFDERLAGAEVHDLLLRLSRGSDLASYAVPAGTSRGALEVSEEQLLVVLGRAWVDWDGVREGLSSREADLVSVVVPTYQDAQMTIRAVVAVLKDATACGVRVEVVVVDNGSRREVGVRLAAVFAAEHRVRVVRLPRNLNFAIGCNVGVAASRGAVVVLLNNDTEARRGWLTRMLPWLEDPDVRGVQPLLLLPDDTIQTAGTVFPEGGALPRHFLTGHPPEDAQRMPRRSFAAVTAAALMLRAEEIARLEGFDAAFVNGMEDVDYCLRAVRDLGGWFVVEPTAIVTHAESRSRGRFARVERNRRLFLARWADDLPPPDEDRYADLGFELLPGHGRAVVRRLRVEHVDEAPPRLRWGIKLPSTPGSWGDLWGDTHFADALARALRQLGQDVVTYRWGAHRSSASELDDVVLGIRGLEALEPHPDKVSMLWVISHPGSVDASEVVHFDRVFAASAPWAETMTAASGRVVTALQQAVDTATLPDSDVVLGDGSSPVFVGGSNPPVRDRTSIHAAAAAGIGLVVHGHGWDRSPVAPLVASKRVEPSRVPTLYRQHGLVLADHWPDMAAHGFVANRVFEAVAAGARVVSDPVVGIEELFQGAVQTYRTLDELRELCSPAGRDRWPSDDEMARIATETAQAHSFERRAVTLLDAAALLRR